MIYKVFNMDPAKKVKTEDESRVITLISDHD